MTDRLRVLSLAILGLLITSMITRSSDTAWLILPLAAYLAAGLWQAPDTDKILFKSSRNLEQTRQGSQVTVETTVTVENASRQPVCVCLNDTLPEYATFKEGSLMEWAYLKPSESVSVNYSFTSKRGDYSWNTVRVTSCDPLSLIQSTRKLPAAGDIQVRPSVHKFKAISLRPHSTLHAPGSIPARLGGSGTDFYGVREYHAGDPLRSLDWHQTARHPNKFFTREFEQEEIAEIGLILDSRPAIEMRVGNDSLFEHGVNAAASLAETFIHQGHRVSLMVFGRRTSIAFPGYGKTQLHRIMKCLSSARVEIDGHSSPHIDFLPIRMFPGRSMIIVISPLISGDLSLFQRLRASGYQTLLISPNPIDFCRSILPDNQYTQMAIRTVHIERHLMLDSIGRLQVQVIDWNVNQPLFPLVRNALVRTRGHGV